MKFRWAHDKWTSVCYVSDKWLHACAGFMGTVTLLMLWPRQWLAWLIVAFLAAILWEVKDALYTPENVGTPGHWLLKFLLGDGFSWKDMLCTWGGILAAWLLAVASSLL